MIIDLSVISRILVLLLLFSCSKKEQEYYYYAHYYNKDSIPSSYLLRKVQYEKGYRTDLVFSSKNIEGPFTQEGRERYILKKNGLDRVILKEDSMVQKPYLSTKNNDCVEFLFENGMDDIMATTLCFLGREDITLGNNEYRKAYKFRKKQGGLDGIELIVYYDTDFILLREEYVSGYTEKYRIVRLSEPKKS